MSTFLIFDFNNLLMKGIAVHEQLEFAGKNTGGLFGFLSQISYQINLHNPSKILVCSDSRPYFREKVYPQYKEGRRKRQDPERYRIIQENRKYCRELLYELNISFWEVKGFEADDLIAEACDTFSYEFDKTIIVSSDDDLFQLLKFPDVYLQRNKNLYSRTDFKKEFPNVSNKLWMRAKAIAGGHNGVKGFHGIGMAKSLKLVKDPEKFKEFLNKNKEEFGLYMKLTKIPFPGEFISPIRQLLSINYKEGRLSRFLAQYGIKLQPHMKQAFEKL